MSAKTMFYTIQLIIMLLIINWAVSLVKPRIENFSDTPENQALFELKKPDTGVTMATLAYANSSTAFKPYQVACKTSVDPVVQSNCAKFTFFL